MPYCRICDVRKVTNEGDICPVCKDEMINQGTDDTSRNDLTQDDRGSSYSESEVVDSRNNSRKDDQYRVHSNRWIRGQSTIAKQYSVNKTADYDGGNRHTQGGAQNVQVVPPTVSAPPSQTVTPSNDSALTEGVVRNVQKKEDSRYGLERWLYCFINGISFAFTPDVMEFQVFSNWNSTSNSSGVSADKVVIYGTMNVGEPANDNTVKVYGKRLNNNYIIAERIENTTDGTFVVFRPFRIPPAVVRAISIFVFALVTVGLILAERGVDAPVATEEASMIQMIMKVGISILSIFITLISLKHAFTNIKKMNWHSVLLHLIIAVVAIVSIFFIFI